MSSSPLRISSRKTESLNKQGIEATDAQETRPQSGVLKGTGFNVKGTGFGVKGTGFSPYMKAAE
jgi:hypothetical protein